jgi:hypothetical protein
VLKTIREAAKAAEMIPAPVTKISTLVSIAEAYAKAGDRDSAKTSYRAALRVNEELTPPKKEEFGDGEGGSDGRISRGDGLLGWIAESQARNNFIGDAVETVRKIRAQQPKNRFLAEIAKAFARSGKIPEALRLAEDVKDPGKGELVKRSLLVEIAHIQAMDLPKTDRRWIDELPDPAVKSRVLLGVAAGLSGQDYQPSKYRPNLQ